MIKKTVFFILLGIHISGTNLLAQDPVYTQFSNSILSYNPACTGLYEGLHVRFITRNQAPALETTIRSYHFSADLADRNLPGSGGLGLVVNTDNEGAGFVNKYNLGVSFAVRVPFTRSIVGQMGIKAGLLRKYIDWDEFERSKTTDERYGYLSDSAYVRPNVNSINRPDFGVGGVVQFVNGKGCLSGTVGLSVDHLFEPDESFLQTEKAPLPRKWTANVDLVWSVNCHSGHNGLKPNVMKLNPGIVIQHQGNISTLMAGMNATKYGLYLGLWYKGEFGTYQCNTTSLIAGYRYVFAENMSIKFTYSYDKPLSEIEKKTGGAHEISLVLEFNTLKLFKGSGSAAYRSSGPQHLDNQLAQLAL
jgi:type IX secretion system PorP/SprF family membrane protein